MNELAKIVQQFFLAFGKMSPAQKVSVGLVFFSSIIMIVAMVLWLSQPEYTVLYANLDPQDAAQVRQKLDEMNIPVKVKGTVIMVPNKFVYDARLMLAGEGLPSGRGVGYELFDKTSPIATTNYLQRINYKRALEGELARTISTIKGIRQARVHLVLPKKEIFSDESTPASASVVVDTGYGLPKSQLRAIVHLVASSVEGLSPENVTIVDTYGNLLFGGENVSGGLSSAQLDMKKSVEKYLEQKAMSMLSGVLGPGKAVVRVNADLDFTRIEKTEERYDPEGLVPRSEEMSREVSPSPEGEEKKEHSITNYEIAKTVAHIVESAGNIKRLAVAVVIDGKYEEKEGRKEYTPRSEEEKNKLKDLVSQAVGLNVERGDTITITEIPFDRTNIQEQEKKLQQEQMLSMALAGGKYVGAILLILVGVILIQGMVKNISQSLPRPETPVKTTPRRPKEPDIGEVISDNYDLAADVLREYIEGEEEES